MRAVTGAVVAPPSDRATWNRNPVTPARWAAAWSSTCTCTLLTAAEPTCTGMPAAQARSGAAAVRPAAGAGRSTSTTPAAGQTGAGSTGAVCGRAGARPGATWCPGTRWAPAAAGRWWSRGAGGWPARTGRTAIVARQTAATDHAAARRRSRVGMLAPGITACTSDLLPLIYGAPALPQPLLNTFWIWVASSTPKNVQTSETSPGHQLYSVALYSVRPMRSAPIAPPGQGATPPIEP